MPFIREKTTLIGTEKIQRPMGWAAAPTARLPFESATDNSFAFLSSVASSHCTHYAVLW